VAVCLAAAMAAALLCCLGHPRPFRDGMLVPYVIVGSCQLYEVFKVRGIIGYVFPLA
jgi:hypothetical protein